MAGKEQDLASFVIEIFSSRETIGFLCGFLMSVVFVIWLILPRKKKESEPEEIIAPVGKKRKQQEEQGLSKKQLIKKAENRKLEIQFSHPSLAGHLRGHQECLTDITFDERGKYLITASKGKELENNRKYNNYVAA